VFLISDLCTMLESYLDKEQVAEIYRAYLFGAEAHEGQTRMSGEPYIYHPIQVAKILTEMRMDSRSIIAAILHDVIEDTPFAKEQLAALFGDDVAELVDGVSKLTHIQFESKAQAQAENLRKLVLSMVRDIRVILIKLADRLHNMRTLGVMRPDKKRRIARETLEIYAPIANRLGINAMRHELEELGFAAYYPMRYKVLSEQVRKLCGHRREVVQKVLGALEQRLAQEGVAGRVFGREKHLYSIYKKMRSKHLSFAEVSDVYAFRIVVQNVDACYRTLGVVHNLYKPVPGKFKDYIAIPKTNGYQSLHTTLQTPFGFTIEVQIRTEEMDRVAEAGIAAHWLYKSGDGNGNMAQARAREWLRSLLEMQKSAGDSLEFLEHVKVDLFPDEVYVFTPEGDIMELPKRATAVDFAYAVHTDVGNSAVAVKINHRLAPLSSRLYSGARVQVITSPGARPNPAWLNFVTTAKARANIRHYLKNMQRHESEVLGRRLLNQALAVHALTLDSLPLERLDRLLQELRLDTVESLLAEVGLGNRMAAVLAERLARSEEETAAQERVQSSGPLLIKGTEGSVVSFAKCCRPIPGDPVIGYLSAGRGVVVHLQSCKNSADFRKHPEKWIEVAWEEDAAGDFSVDLRVDVNNQRGVLATVAAAIAETDANIENVTLEQRDGISTSIHLTVGVRNRSHLARILRRVRALDRVLRIHRG